jgi:hypothetical protein
MILVHPQYAYFSVKTVPSKFNRIPVPPALCCADYTNYINVIEVAARARGYTHSAQFDLVSENEKRYFNCSSDGTWNEMGM